MHEKLRFFVFFLLFVHWNYFRLETATNDENEISQISCPDFSQYLYFLFAPTLIYCDKYPQNAVIHWDYVLQMFGQVFAAIIYVYYVVVRFCVPVFSNLNQNQITLPIFLSVLFNSIMPGSLFLLLGKVFNENKKTMNFSFSRFLRIFALLAQCFCRNASICWSNVL